MTTDKESYQNSLSVNKIFKGSTKHIMELKFMKRLAFATLITCLGSGSAFAEIKWGLGLAVLTGDSLYTDVERESTVLPVLSVQTENFYFIGTQFGYEFAEYNGLEYSLIGDYRGDGYSAEDEPIFSGMEDRSGTYELGIEVEYESDLGDISFRILNDALGEHSGNEVSFKYGLPFIQRRGIVTPYFSITQLSDDLVDYYYGVRSDEATISRSTYDGESSTVIEVGVDSMWRFGEHHRAVFTLSYSMFGDEIKDSPIVDSDSSVSTLVGYVYAF